MSFLHGDAVGEPLESSDCPGHGAVNPEGVLNSSNDGQGMGQRQLFLFSDAVGHPGKAHDGISYSRVFSFHLLKASQRLCARSQSGHPFARGSRGACFLAPEPGVVLASAPTPGWMSAPGPGLARVWPRAGTPGSPASGRRFRETAISSAGWQPPGRMIAWLMRQAPSGIESPGR